MLSRIVAAYQNEADHQENFLKGYKIQRWILSVLPGAKSLEYERDSNGQAMRNLPYDIEYKGKTVDIKSSWNSWDDQQFLFTIENGDENTHNCEYFLCVGVVDDVPIKIWMIPSKSLDFHTNFTPAIRNKRESKYDKWLVWKDHKALGKSE